MKLLRKYGLSLAVPVPLVPRTVAKAVFGTVIVTVWGATTLPAAGTVNPGTMAVRRQAPAGATKVRWSRLLH